MHNRHDHRPANNQSDSATRPTMRLSRNRGKHSGKTREKRKKRTHHRPPNTNPCFFPYGFCTLALPKHAYFIPGELACRSTKVFLCFRVVFVGGGWISQDLTRCNRTIFFFLPSFLIDLPTSSDRLNNLVFSSLSFYLPGPLPPSRSYYL